MNPEILLAPLVVDDVNDLARLHRLAFPGFFLSTLGERFLVQFYRGFLNDRFAVTVVAKSRGGLLLGVAVGTTQPLDFFRRLVRRRWAGFALASLHTIFTHPAAAPRLIRAVCYRGLPGSSSGALLSSICVDPTFHGEGIGGQLLSAWSAEAARRGVRSASLTTDAENNDRGNRLYQTQEWLLMDCYRTREGRLLNQYSKRLRD